MGANRQRPDVIDLSHASQEGSAAFVLDKCMCGVGGVSDTGTPPRIIVRAVAPLTLGPSPPDGGERGMAERISAGRVRFGGPLAGRRWLRGGRARARGHGHGVSCGAPHPRSLSPWRGRGRTADRIAAGRVRFWGQIAGRRWLRGGRARARGDRPGV